MLIAHTKLLLQIIDRYWVFFKRWKSILISQSTLSEVVIEFILIFCHNIAALFKIWT